jgi:hypothetical protein
MLRKRRRNMSNSPVRHALRVGLILALLAASLQSAARPILAEDAAAFAFQPDGRQYQFDTGLLRGTLRLQGQSLGLVPLVDTATGSSLARGKGLFSHYRLLDAAHRYGAGGWDWPSVARLAGDGSVVVDWSADDGHPFAMQAVYRWTAPGTLDLTTTVVATQNLPGLEVFLACYFDGFPESFVYVGGCPETGGQAGLLEARQEVAVWQMFPRDDRAVRLIEDGRWERPPHPVQWKIMPRLAAPLAVRRDPERNLAALVMAPPGDCFAVATPYGAESHRSLYLSLLGRDLSAGGKAVARARLVIGRDISDERAIALYHAYIRQQ